MAVVTVHEAKTHLSRLIAEALAGGEVIIARGKEPAVRLVPVDPKPKRVPGRLKGKIAIGPEFFEPMSEEELRLWGGGDEGFLNGYLLDTHTLIWWLMDSPRLAKRARETLAAEDEPVLVSAVTALEIANKHRIGKLPEVGVLMEDYRGHLAGEGFRELPISPAHALHAGSLTIEHRDPFDRLLISQSRLEGLVLVSNERLFDRFGVTRLWD